MTIYGYRCPAHGDTDIECDMGTAPKSIHCPACSGEALRVYGGARIAMAAMPNKAGFGRVMEVDRTESTWQRDLPAYKRMRHKGLQPPSTEGAAALENRADSQFDINYDRALFHAQGRGGKQRVVDAVGAVGGLM